MWGSPRTIAVIARRYSTCLGFGIWNLGFGVRVSGVGFWGLGLGSRALDFGFRVERSGLTV